MLSLTSWYHYLLSGKSWRGNIRAGSGVTEGPIRRICLMDKDRIEGAAKQAKGAVKEAVGKVTGDAKTQAEGRKDKAEGKVQNAIGGAKDAIREALNN
jgi:uncharacterized protein YjbJ (UPF0337 family)